MRRFETPDDLFDMEERGGNSNNKKADGTTGMRATFEPGRTWIMDEKPLLGSPDACLMRHTGYCIAIKLVVRMVDARAETAIASETFSRLRRAMTPMSTAPSAST